MNKGKRIFVIGYMGTPRREYAEALCETLNKSLLAENPSVAECNLYRHLDMDKEIERLDGRSILRLCMTMGEHEYRNKEYELLSKLSDADFDIGIAKEEDYGQNLVISCGDGILLDEMCLAMLKKYAEKGSCTVDFTENSNNPVPINIIKDSGVVLLEAPLSELWQSAKADNTLTYAFMHTGTENERRKKFEELYTARKHLYDSLK